MLRIVLALAFLFLGPDAETAERSKRAAKPTEPVITPIRANDNVLPVKFQRVASNIGNENSIGTAGYGLLCIEDRQDIPASGVFGLDPRSYENEFNTELRAANYKIGGEERDLFNDRQAQSPRYLVGALLNKVQLDVCFRIALFGNRYDQVDGTAKIEVEWQIFDSQERKIVLRVTTPAQAKGSAGPGDGLYRPLHLAFAQATRALLANQEFHNLLHQTSLPADALAQTAPAEPLFKIKLVPLSAVRFQDRALDVRANVVTIFQGEGSGSGFFVNDGLVLTNSHVVGGAKFVKVRLLTGREVLGEVAATNARRDVALIKTEPVGLQGLPVHLAEAGVGAQVFVIGSPAGVENEGTVLPGIVSTYRVIEDQPFIQSNAPTLPGSSGGPMVDENGNVIGITVMGQPYEGQRTALNYFIPIGDAMKKLGVEAVGN
jgi:S1-C subfamily serine protease